MLTSAYFIQVNQGKISLKNDNIVLPELKDFEILISTICSSISNDNVNLDIDGFYSPSNVVCGTVETVGINVHTIQPGSMVVGFINESETSGLSQYCTLNEAFAYPIPSNIDPKNIAALLLDFFIVMCVVGQLPNFPKPATYLIIDAKQLLSHVIIHELKKFGKKIMLYTHDSDHIPELESLYPDLTVIKDSTCDFVDCILSETFGIGVGCIIDLRSTQTMNDKIISEHQLACALAIGGTICSFRKLNNSCKFAQIIQNKSSHLIFPNVISLLTCENFIEKFKEFADMLTCEISDNNLRPVSVQEIHFSEISTTSNSENLLCLLNKYKIIVTYP